jgi:SET domain-containing protein
MTEMQSWSRRENTLAYSKYDRNDLGDFSKWRNESCLSNTSERNYIVIMTNAAYQANKTNGNEVAVSFGNFLIHD